ncbi:MAG: hypothetical protein IM631_22080 [Cytophagales bacterium]|nr:hypothetical protein [Cytophagales bacterium]MCA6374052.1 hypothetical protein [Cytophagales bacterium]MCA6376817.1 hypothetical protein [Cytophagales bacterium]MCA6383819.1 hypothetical protein [Cytophagales bacterium]
MRKLTLIILACFYLLLSVGIAKSTHFCMGREQNSSLFSFEAKKCPCFRSMEKAKSCCEDEHEIVKIEDDHSTSQVVHSPTPTYNLISVFFFEIENLFPQPELFSFAELDLVPPKIPIYEAVCSLVFYESEV